jgi:hypothetical protein
MTGLTSIPFESGPAAARRLLDQSPLGVVEVPRAPLDELPYRDFVLALLRKQGFKLDFNRLEPDAALTLVSDQLFGAGAFVRDRALLAADIAALAHFAGGLTATRPSISIRTYFAPGDLVWHVDRVNERAAFRLLWPLGRPAGMRVTSADNIDPIVYRAYMRREYPLLGQLDTRILRTGAGPEALWAHRPMQLAAMISGRFPFLVDAEKEWEVTPGAASIHRLQTPGQTGSYHRSAWANRRSPGLQIVITAASD